MATHHTPWYTGEMMTNRELRRIIKEEYGGDEKVAQLVKYVGRLEYQLAHERAIVRQLEARLTDIEAIGA